MSQRYILKREQGDVKLIHDEYVCLGCGKSEMRTRPEFLPLPNITGDGKASKLSCFMGVHTFAPREKVILNDKRMGYDRNTTR